MNTEIKKEFKEIEATVQLMRESFEYYQDQVNELFKKDRNKKVVEESNILNGK